MDWAVLQVMLIPEIVTTCVEVLSIDGNQLGVVPRHAAAPGSHPKKNRGIVAEVTRKGLDDLGTIGLLQF